MADVPHQGENTPEYVAYLLFQRIMSAENMSSDPQAANRTAASRDWILRTYGECIDVVRNGRAGIPRRSPEAPGDAAGEAPSLGRPEPIWRRP